MHPYGGSHRLFQTIHSTTYELNTNTIFSSLADGRPINAWPDIILQIQPETREYLVFFFKTLIQLFLLRSFLYSLTYCIKEGIKDNNLEINWKSADLWGSYGLKQGNPLQFFKTLIESYMFCVLIILLTVS